ncbi:uncharacterized protein LOC117304653 [Asterias rubens]|uniref:uncharacterized protein LOC117304653 n=1 Tax=Asterias rubens TaxID=7604 RepID=UPI001454F78F|nr:uncharacterized protein LOC117304653 [Asterias rubens]
MPWHNLSEFIPWILAIFFVLFLIACCSWLYRCVQKCEDQCPGILPARSPYNPNSPMTPFPNIRHTRNCESTRRMTMRRATQESNNEPSGSIMSSTSIVHYHGPKSPPYAERPPPPSYEEACGSGVPSLSQQQATSAAIIDTEPIPTENIESVSVSSVPHSDVRDVVNDSVVIDIPQDEPLINDDDDDDDDMELQDVVIEPTALETANSDVMETGDHVLL